MRTFDAVFFDIDGTLFDSNSFHAHAWSRAVESFGFSRSVDFFLPLIGMGGDSILPKIDPALGPETALGEEISAERQRIVLEEYATAVQPFPAARDLVRTCHERGARCIIATSSSAAERDRFLEKLDIAKFIDDGVSSSEAEHAKPAPDVVEVALKKAGVAPTRAVLIGDTQFDIMSAKKAGIAAIALRCGGSSDAQLAGAVAIYDDPTDLLAHISEVLG